MQPHPAPEGRVVTLGPLPMRMRYLLAPAVIGSIAALIGFGSLFAALVPPEPRRLRCSRVAEVITCDEWSGAQQVRTVSVLRSGVRFTRVGGHHPKRCLQLGVDLVCSPGAEQHAARLRALRDGGSAVLDVTEGRSWIASCVGLLFAGALLALTAAQLARTLGRKRRVVVSVGPRDVRRPGAPIARTPWEAVRVARLGRPGRGEYPRAVIEYWDGGEWVTLGAWTAFDPDELEPHAAQLRAALAAIPRAG